MSLAEDLLNSLPEDQPAATSADPATEPHIVINPDRTVTVPESLRHIAVEGDHNIETVTFDCPRYWDGHDLSQMRLQIVFQRPDGHREPHLAENVHVNHDDANVIHFDWTISNNVTYSKGTISFLVCAKIANGEGIVEREWHTRLNQDLIVDEGMECSGEEIVEQNPDIIEAILAQLDELKNSGGNSGQNPTENGFSPIATVTQTATGATINITDKNGTTTATITNGKDGVDGKDGYTPQKGIDYFDGKDGQDGRDGLDGQPGRDGTSTTVSVTPITGGHRITITDKNGTKTADVLDGKNGEDGKPGTDGSPGRDGSNGADGKDGFSPIATVTQTATGATISITDVNGTTTATVTNGKDWQNVNQIEPAEDDIPKVFFGAALPQTKDDTIMSFRYISKTMDVSGYCKTKAQGNSSMSYPKKNQTVKLYKDAECTEKLKVDFKGWGKQNKFCFKANWIDLTHARNIVSARLWGDVVKSRANYDSIPELLQTSPNQAAVDGFPVKVYAAGIYQGRYTINIPKDAWMANMDDELDNHCILCGENYVSGCFRAEAKIDGSDWTDEVHDVVPTPIKNRWNEAIRFVMNSTDEEFVAGIGNYFDVPSLIDYYIFGLVTLNNDGFGKNQLYMTYDGMKWYAVVYDLDNTFGTYLGSVLSNEFPRGNYEDYKHSGGNLLYTRLESLFADVVKGRYDELKNSALSVESMILHFERFTDIAPPYLVEEDYAETTANGAFTEIPLQAQSNIQQIRKCIVARYPYVDYYVENLGIDPTLMYKLPAETIFNGVDEYFDTGLKLFDIARDFTVICDLTQGTNSNNKIHTIWNCTNGNNGDSYAGARLGRYPYENNGICLYAVHGKPSHRACATVPDAERVKIAVVFHSGIPESVLYKQENSNTVSAAALMNTGSFGYTAHDRTMILGAAKWADVQDYWAGTIHSFEVYSKAMSASELEAKLME